MQTGRSDDVGIVAVSAQVTGQQRDPLEPVKLLIELALPLRVGEERDPFGRGLEDHALAGEAGADPERDRDEASMSVKWLLVAFGVSRSWTRRVVRRSAALGGGAEGDGSPRLAR